MDKKRILIISAAIYPRNTPRAHRATELAKEFARKGHNVTLYAVLGNYDYSNFINKYNVKVKNIGRMFFYPVNSDGEIKQTFLLRILTRLFKRFIEFPDIELFFKISNVLRKEKEVDLLITNAIPHTLHWGAALYKTRKPMHFPKTWIADCGDPYMGNVFHQPYFYFKYIEKWFCKKADYISVPFEGAKKAYYPEFHYKIITIPQGFNYDDIEINNGAPNNPVPTFLYAGAFYKDNRDPSLFLQHLCKIRSAFKFIIYTRNAEIIKPFVEKLGEKIEIRNYIPRSELLKVMSRMDFLINFDNNSELQLPSKLIDYAITNRPILSIRSNTIPQKMIDDFLSGNYSGQLLVKNIEQYDIKNIAAKFLLRIK
jgi:hypothetical protein